MNIIILSSSKSQSGGVERFSFYLQDCFIKNGHKVSILSKEDLSPLQALIVRLKKYAGFEQPALGYFLGRKALQQGFDVCVTNGMLGWNIAGKPTINVQHGTFARAAVRIDRSRNIFKYVMKRYIWGSFEGLAARRAIKCIAVSKETAKSVSMFYGRKDVGVILNAVDTNLFAPSDKTKKNQALFVGRFEIAKGKEILEQMDIYLRSIGWDLVVPQGKSQEELSVLYKESQVFLLPSLHEGCSYALMDAMACGLPFLASPVGLVPELKEKGLFADCIVHIQTGDAYFEAFKKLVHKSEQEKAQLSQELRNYIIEYHSIDQFNQKYSALLNEITSSDTRR